MDYIPQQRYVNDFSTISNLAAHRILLYNLPCMANTSHSQNISHLAFVELLKPSWLSGVLCVFLGLVVSVGTVVINNYKSSPLRLDIIDYKSSHTLSNITSNGILSNTLVKNLPLLLFWVVVGIVVYICAANIMRALSNTAEMKSEMEYVHANKHDIIVSAIEELGFRIGALLAWVVYIVFFFRHIVPYCVDLSLVGAGQLHTVTGYGYVMLSIVVLAVSLHINVILLRLLLLRPRVFGSVEYIES